MPSVVGNIFSGLGQGLQGFAQQKDKRETDALKEALLQREATRQDAQLKLQQDQEARIAREQDQTAFRQSIEGLAPGSELSDQTSAKMDTMGFGDYKTPGQPLIGPTPEGPPMDGTGPATFKGFMPPSLQAALAQVNSRDDQNQAMNEYRFGQLERQGAHDTNMASYYAAMAAAAGRNAGTNEARTNNLDVFGMMKAVKDAQAQAAKEIAGSISSFGMTDEQKQAAIDARAKELLAVQEAHTPLKPGQSMPDAQLGGTNSLGLPGF